MTLDHRPAVPLWLLGVFTFSGPVGMHIFVPALPAAAKDLHATPAALELTISLYILGLAVGQLVYGPASDRFGRRPALLVGLSIFTIASIAGLFAPDIHTLVLARVRDEDIIDRLHQAGFPNAVVREIEPSLEDVFVTLTEQAAAARGEAPSSSKRLEAVKPGIRSGVLIHARVFVHHVNLR